MLRNQHNRTQKRLIHDQQIVERSTTAPYLTSADLYTETGPKIKRYVIVEDSASQLVTWTIISRYYFPFPARLTKLGTSSDHSSDPNPELLPIQTVHSCSFLYFDRR